MSSLSFPEAVELIVEVSGQATSSARRLTTIFLVSFTRLIIHLLSSSCWCCLVDDVVVDPARLSHRHRSPHKAQSLK